MCLIHHQIYSLANQMSYNTFQVMFVLFPHVSIHSYIFWKSIKYHTWYFFQELWIILSSANINSFFKNHVFHSKPWCSLANFKPYLFFLQGCIFCRYSHPQFFQDIWKFPSPGYSFLLCYIKIWGRFSRGAGEFFSRSRQNIHSCLILFLNFDQLSSY